MEKTSKEKKWLIKSSARLLGPYSIEEVVEMVRTKQISIIDEIREPVGRWAYVRENSIFLEVVQNIREEQDSQSEETMTQTLGQQAITKSDVVSVREDFTTTPVFVDAENESIRPNHETPIKDITPDAEIGIKKPESNSSKIRSYGVASDGRVQSRILEKSKMARFFLMGLSTVVVILFGLLLNLKDRQKSLGFDEQLSMALKYRDLGLYEKSLLAYNKAIKMGEVPLEFQMKMAPVLISEDRQSIGGRRVLERALLQDGHSRTEVVEAYLGIANSYVIDGDLKQAEDVLQKVLGYDPNNIFALLNMAIIAQKKGNYVKAIDGFESIYLRNPKMPFAVYGRALSILENPLSVTDNQILRSLIRELNEVMQLTTYLHQELSLMLVYVYQIIGDHNNTNLALVHFLNQIPGQAKNYSHSIYFDWRITQWDYLDKFCQEIYRKSTPHPQVKAMRAICLMESNRDTEAEKLLSEARAEAPKDPYLLATQASYLNKMGRFNESLVILKMPELQNLLIRYFLQGEACSKLNDIQCAKKAYDASLNLSKNSPLAYFGNAWVESQLKNHKEAYYFVLEGLEVEPTFIPLLELRDHLESRQ